MNLESTYFIPSMVAIGQISQLCPGEFASPVRGIVTKFIVKELLMQDRVSLLSVWVFMLEVSQSDHFMTGPGPMFAIQSE